MKRLVFVLLAVLLSLLSVLAGGRAPLAAAQSGPTASTTSLENQTPVEIPSLRTRYSRTYQVAGLFHADITATPQNFKAADGSWQPISDTLVPTTTSGFAYQNQADDPTVLLPSTLATGPVRLDDGSSWVSFALTGHSSLSNAAAVTGSTATYTIPTGSITETASPSGLTEALTLSGATAPSTYSWNLATSADLTAQTNVSGGIDFLNASGQVVLTMPAPVMTDAAGNSSFNVHLSVAQTSLGQTLTLTADSAWLADPSRVYPVTIDPSTYTADASQGCTLESANPTTSSCTGSGGYTVSDVPNTGEGGGDTIDETLLQFNLSSIPSNMQVLDTQLGLHAISGTGGNPLTVSIYQLTHSWTSSATWNTYDGTNSWSTPGGDYNPTAVFSNTDVAATVPSWSYFAFDQLVQGWVDGSIPNDGVLARTFPIGTMATSATFDSAATSAANQPSLEVWYSPWLGAPSQFTFDSGVNVFNGNLILGSTDLAMSGIGLPLTVSRVFNGLFAGGPGPFGNGWSAAGRPNGYLYPFGDGDVVYYAPDGSRWPFQLAGSGSGAPFISPPGIDADLVNTGNDTYSLTSHGSQEVLHFYGNRVTSDVDRGGNTISYGYDSSGRLTTIIDTQNRTTTLSYNSPVSSSLISEITDPAGRTYQYSYDSSQNLTTYTDPNGKVTQYAYDPSHDDELTQITDPDGNEVQFTYASLKVTSITQVNTTPGSANPTTTFTYNSGNTVVTDPNNHQTTYTYDPLGRVTALKDARGYTWQTSWTSDNNVASTTTSSGHTTSYSYDGNNNLTGVTLPTSPVTSESCAYANASFPYQPSSCTDERGKTTTYGYDSAGRVNSVTDADNHTSSVIYNSNGTVQSETDANNHTTTHTYSTSGTSVGLSLQDTPPAPKGTTSYTFDPENRESGVTDGNGKLTTFTYNADDQLIGETFGGQVSITYTYDNDGNVLSMADGTGTTYYRYNSLNELTSELLPTGATITCPGPVTASACYSYDLAGNLTSKTDSGGTVTYGYDPNDEVNTVTDRQNGHYTLGYDQDGNETSLAFPNGVTESMGYTSVGQLSSISAAKPGSGPLTSFSYSYVDPSTNLPTSIPFSRTDTSGNTTTYGYDNTGTMTGVTLKNGGGTTLHSYSYGYDNAGNLGVGSVSWTVECDG